MVRVKSISADGVYYLVNGWHKYNQFWHKNGDDQRCHFKDAKTAKTSLTKLLKTFPEYLDDEIIFEEI